MPGIGEESVRILTDVKEMAAAWLYLEDMKAAPMGQLFWPSWDDLPDNIKKKYLDKIDGIEKVLHSERSST